MEISRREFVRFSGLVVLGGAVAACSSKPSAPEGSLEAIIGDRTQKLTFIAVGTELLSGSSQRLAFGLVRENELLVDVPGRVWFAKSRTDKAEGPFEIEFHGEGLPANRGYYETQVEFPSDGIWRILVEAEVDGENVITSGEVQVGATNQMPKPGDKAIKVATPTRSKSRGVNPICTAVPPCGMHSKSLDTALEDGDDIVMMIATPAYCTSQLCGPEVELLDQIRETREANGITFIHVEVLENDDPDTVSRFNPLAPAAAAWNLQEEPALYTIKNGKVVDRLLGPADLSTLRSAVTNLNQA